MVIKLIAAGLMKSGCSSVRYALRSIGWNPLGYMRGPFPFSADYVIGAASRYDAIADLPAAAFWRELAEAYPDAKVLLTPRDDDEWADSIEDWLKPEHEPFTTIAEHAMAVKLFGSGTFNRDGWIRGKRRHEGSLRRWGERYPERFLELDVIGGEGWDKLAPFLGVDKRGPFPKVRPGAPQSEWRNVEVRQSANQGKVWR